jgi:Bacterial PH domain
MSERPWWSLVLQWGIWALVMSLVMGWLAKARRPAAVRERAQVLTHPPTTLIVGMVCTGFFILLAVLAGMYAKADDWWTPYAFLCFALLGAPLIGEALRVRHELKDGGIGYRGLLARYDRVSWDEIESAHWSSSMKWLVLRTRDGRVLRFSAMLNGLDSLALALHERVPALDVDELTAEVLADARNGKLPSIWG